MPRATGHCLGEVFDRVVAEMCGDTEAVGVNFSGGLDSLAVLVAVCQLAQVRRVVAFTVDLVDDDDASTAVAAADLVADLGLPADLVVVEPDGAGPVPPWSPLGPRFDALPRVNARVNAAAATAGCGVLLSGNGADELLAAGSFATAQVAGRWGLRGVRRYLADMAGTAAGRLGEAVAVVARVLPANWSARGVLGGELARVVSPDGVAVTGDPSPAGRTEVGGGLGTRPCRWP
ncbi:MULTISPECIES: asparagine synthase-related protein [unclassified Micromonospora]|uniref:asparagine synthase-related protein n=1 Tax=unclassified Micromonospora TaxID=2617518 RepID=UPI003A89E127